MDRKVDLDIDVSDDEDNESVILTNDHAFLSTESGKSSLDTPDDMVYLATPKCLRKFERVERAGTEASYRCIRCRGCEHCKKSGEGREVFKMR